jgi:hypothetical protein
MVFLFKMKISMASLRPLCDCENLQQIVEYFAEEAWNFA